MMMVRVIIALPDNLLLEYHTRIGIVDSAFKRRVSISSSIVHKRRSFLFHQVTTIRLLSLD